MIPKIGAAARHAQKLAQTWDTECDETKAMLTWRTADRFIYEVAEGNVEQLFKYVGNPADFIERRKPQASSSPTRRPCGSSFEARREC